MIIIKINLNILLILSIFVFSLNSHNIFKKVNASYEIEKNENITFDEDITKETEKQKGQDEKVKKVYLRDLKYGEDFEFKNFVRYYIEMIDEPSFIISFIVSFKNNRKEKIRVYFNPVKLYSKEKEEKKKEGKKTKLNTLKKKKGSEEKVIKFEIKEEDFENLELEMEDKKDFVELEENEEKKIKLKFKSYKINADVYIIKFPGFDVLININKNYKDFKNEDKNDFFVLKEEKNYKITEKESKNKKVIYVVEIPKKNNN